MLRKHQWPTNKPFVLRSELRPLDWQRKIRLNCFFHRSQLLSKWSSLKMTLEAKIRIWAVLLAAILGEMVFCCAVYKCLLLISSLSVRVHIVFLFGPVSCLVLLSTKSLHNSFFFVCLFVFNFVSYRLRTDEYLSKKSQKVSQCHAIAALGWCGIHF